MEIEPSKSPEHLAFEFHMLIGYCIVAWSSVDEVLFSVFRHCVGPVEQSAIIYYRVPGLDARFGLTEELVLSLLPKTHPGDQSHSAVIAWKKSIAGYQSLLATRRRIAHHPVQFTWESPPGRGLINRGELDKTPFDLITNFQVLANQHERLRQKSTGQKPLEKSDLYTHFLEVSALSKRLDAFFQETMTKYEPTFPSRDLPPTTPEYPEEGPSTAPQPPPGSSLP